MSLCPCVLKEIKHLLPVSVLLYHMPHLLVQIFNIYQLFRILITKRSISNWSRKTYSVSAEKLSKRIFHIRTESASTRFPHNWRRKNTPFHFLRGLSSRWTQYLPRSVSNVRFHQAPHLPGTAQSDHRPNQILDPSSSNSQGFLVCEEKCFSIFFAVLGVRFIYEWYSR